MGERRMLTTKITDNDNFMSLPSSAQALYLHLVMAADDDGFCSQVTLAMFKAHADVTDLQALIEKKYIYQFPSNAIVIKHWRMANSIRKDRYEPTVYQEEYAQLQIKDNGSYTLTDNGCQVVAKVTTNGCQMVAKRLPQDKLSKVKLSKDNKKEIIKEKKHAYGEYKHVLLTDKEYQNLADKLGTDMRDKCITYLDEYIEMKGYKAKNHNLVIQKWVVDAVKRNGRKGSGDGNNEQPRTNAYEDAGSLLDGLL